MTQPWLSLTGLYNHDPSILDNLRIPTAADYAALALEYPDLIVTDPFIPDKDALVNYMLFALAELPLVYTDPEFFKTMVWYWSRVKEPVFKQIYRTTLYKYNPIWNKDGSVTETRTITYSKDGETSGSGTVTTDTDTTNTGTVTTETETHDTGTVGRQGSSSGSTEHQVTGFDTNSYSPDKKDLTSSTASETTTNNLTVTGEETVTNNLAGTEDSTVASRSAGTSAEIGESEDIFTRSEKGNIGVTTTQSMIKEQREVAGFSFYEYVTNEFKKEFCVAIW